MIPCSNRIQEILEWVNGECIADIGCDHAYVVCNAILNHQSKKGYACDVAQGPLDNAKKTIEENHLSDLVSCRLLDGIQGLESDVDYLWHGRKTHYRYPIKGKFVSWFTPSIILP